jgi:hypothetical protein
MSLYRYREQTGWFWWLWLCQIFRGIFTKEPPRLSAELLRIFYIHRHPILLHQPDLDLNTVDKILKFTELGLNVDYGT